MHPTIICFGEVLWDVLSTGKTPGGAPLNVALHLTQQGLFPTLISRVANDELGDTLLAYVQQHGLSTDWVQVGGPMTYPTGVVLANVSLKSEVTYEIIKPVAWDHILYDQDAVARIAGSDVLIYGSLAARSQTTRDTLLRYLRAAKLKVFDVNLRPPHYSPRQIEELLEYADVIKMNHHELVEIMSWYGETGNEQHSLEYLRLRLNAATLIVTRGENGAAVLTREGYYEHPGFSVVVEDTIGSGDAFLAAFLSRYLAGDSPDQLLPYACAVGAYVATQRGATPTVPEKVIRQLMENNRRTQLAF